MQNHCHQIFLLPALAVAVLLTTSCASNRTCQRTVAGATIGAVTGAILDRDGGVGGAIAGGVIGGAVGAATGKHSENRNASPYYYPEPAPLPQYGKPGQSRYPR